MASSTDMRIGEFDSTGLDYNIFALLKDGSTVLYNPLDWHFTELKFESSDETIVTVDKDGTLHAQDIDEAEKIATITVSDIDGHVSATYTVTVKYMDSIKIGFNQIESCDEIFSDSEGINNYRIKTGTYSVNNTTDGYYLWIFSQRKIHYVKSVEENDEVAAELSSGFRVPLTNAIIKDGYFCYRSVAPILKGTMKFKIKFA